MREYTESSILAKQTRFNDAKPIEQINELIRILPEAKFLFFKYNPYHLSFTNYSKGVVITIRDKRYRSMESSVGCFNIGAIVCELFPFKKIKLYYEDLIEVIRQFGNKWKYEKLERCYE